MTQSEIYIYGNLQIYLTYKELKKGNKMADRVKNTPKKKDNRQKRRQANGQ